MISERDFSQIILVSKAKQGIHGSYLGFSSDAGFQCISDSGIIRHPKIGGMGGGHRFLIYND